MVNTPMTHKALAIAKKAHMGQFDKAGKPYINHPLHVAEQMADETTTAVALLHDVVEDSEYTLEDLTNAGFDAQITDALRLLTHNKVVDYFSYVQAIKNNPVAIQVKLADLRHNSDLARLQVVTDKDLERVEKYKKAIKILI